MISAGDFRNGVTFEENGNVLQVVEFQHVKPGKGAAFVRTKTKNVITGAVTEKSYNPSDKFPTAFIERREMQYLYEDGGLYYFMDTETYEQIPLNEHDLSDSFKFVKENEMVKILSYKGNVFGIEDPNFVVLEVTETEPGLAGNTATNTLKPATVETGAEVKVPLFINIGDKISIDTRTGEYIGRAK
mgnify:CR=1 FL=1